MKYFGYHSTFIMQRGSSCLVVDTIAKRIDFVPSVNIDLGDYPAISRARYMRAYNKVAKRFFKFVSPWRVLSRLRLPLTKYTRVK